MKPLADLKFDILNTFRHGLEDSTKKIRASALARDEKARSVNTLVGRVQDELSRQVEKLPVANRPDYALVLKYCFSVASLEYRHQVWPYEYMAFSRRVGELWESFCSAAWDPVPDFGAVRETLSARIKANIGNHGKKDEILHDISTLFEIVGDVNMNEDEVFQVGGVPHVVDFKSGFGSNEKGNMIRLQTVGRAYRIWNHQTRLLLLVRQEENNNYLRVLRRLGLWEVYTGDDAYDQISALTGADMSVVRKSVVNWKADLSGDLYDFLKKADLLGYLSW